jgi:transposase
MEVGGQSPWVSRLAKEQGLDVIVANPRRVQLITRNERKNDRADAELLARLGRVDPHLLSPVTHRSVECQADLALEASARRGRRVAHGADQPCARRDQIVRDSPAGLARPTASTSES